MNKLFLRKSSVSILCLLALGLVASSQAEDETIQEIKTASGKTYQDVRITKVTPSEISIMHESGVARIPLKDLPDDLKAKFGYDPEKEKAEAEIRANAAKKRIEDAAKAAAEAERLKDEPVTSVPLVGNEQTALKIATNAKDLLDKDVIICGGISTITTIIDIQVQ